MKIEKLKSEKKGSRKRVAATVIWEDCGRPSHEVYFETIEAFAKDLTCNPNAFLVACAIPAMHFGEERVFVDGEICPELQDGLMVAMGWLRHWFEPDRKLIRIEAKRRSDLPTPRTPERAGFLFSGGIDSFAALRANRHNFPLDHPWSIKDGLVVYGLELDEPTAFQHVVNSLSDVSHDIGITLIPVYTDLYLHYREEDANAGFDFWYRKFMGAALAAVAHAFSRRLTVVTIASDYDIPNQKPYGSHPLLHSNYSSIDLRIRYDGLSLSRFAKTKLVADWDEALQHLRVCNQYKLYGSGRLNCGKCEKCFRTMLSLLALGALDKTTAFTEDDLSRELVMSAVELNQKTAPLYAELIVPLQKKGRHDLARAIELKLAEYQKRRRMENWKAKLRQFDQKYFKGNLRRFRRKFFT